MESLAQSYFERFTGGGDNAKALAEVEKLINSAEPKNGEQENEALDFKQFIRSDDELKRRLSRSLSAIANTGGATIIWGIHTDKVKREPEGKAKDTAVKLGPIGKIDAFKDRLVHNYKFVTDPPVTGVRFEIVYNDEAKRSGYVVQFIPEGDNKPYYSREDERFYLRVWDESVAMSPHIVRNLFYPSPKIDISMMIDPSYDPHMTAIVRHHGHCTGIWRLRLINDGDTSLENAEILFTKAPSSSLHTFSVIEKPANIGLIPLDGETLQIPKSLHPRTHWDFILGMACQMNPTFLRVDLFARNTKPQSVMLQNPYKVQTQIAVRLRYCSDRIDNVVDLETYDEVYPYS
jgi:hypothetical protein